MNLGQAVSVVQMGLVAGVLTFTAFAVLLPPPMPADTPSLEFGLALLALASIAAITGWGLSGGTGWGRAVGLIVAIASGVAGLFGLYGLISFLGSPESFSRSNLAVLVVLLLMGVTSTVLVAVPLAERHARKSLTSFGTWKGLMWLGSAFVIGIGVAAAFGAFLSTVPEPPCCPA